MGSPRVFCGPFVLIGAMNPCPCGDYGDPVRECTCSTSMVSRYQSDPAGVRRISGPLLDRADLRSDDIHIDVPRVEADSVGRTKSCPASGWASRRPCFRKSRHHPGAGRGGPGAPAAALQGYQAVVQCRRPCMARVGPAKVREYGHLAEAIQYRPRRQS
ncbi:MAG: ATP-binding protein [Chloroflexi bacterium]|nr:ATP-binding protein [Chloroflexota bacterium]